MGARDLQKMKRFITNEMKQAHEALISRHWECVANTMLLADDFAWNWRLCSV